MKHIKTYNFIFFSALFSLTLSVEILKCNVNKYAIEKIFAKYQHNQEEACNKAQCQSTEKCLELIVARINNTYAKHENDSIQNLQQDKTTLQKIKNEASYWFWPNHADDDTTREQAEKSLKNIEQTEIFLHHHTAYLQAQKITKLYETMPVDNEAFKIWVSQNFSTAQQPAIINCRQNIHTALSTIDHFSNENSMQYPQLYHQLSCIKNKINKIFSTLDALYQTAYEKQQQENNARQHRELYQKQIEAQNRASKAQELQTQAEKDKTQKIQELLIALTTLQLHTSSHQVLVDMQNKQRTVHALQQKLDNNNVEEQRLLRELSSLQTLLNAGLDYATLCEKHSDLTKAIEQNKRKIQSLQSQQAILQERIEHTTIPSQAERHALQQQIAHQERQLQKQHETLQNLAGEIPVAQPCSNDTPYVQAQAHYAPEESSNQRPPAYNPDYRKEH